MNWLFQNEVQEKLHLNCKFERSYRLFGDTAKTWIPLTFYKFLVSMDGKGFNDANLGLFEPCLSDFYLI